MIIAALGVLLVVANAVEIPVARVADDAKVVDRVAEVSRRDLPRDLLRRIVAEDIELLRGRRPDGTYQYATYERMEAGRISDSFSIQPSDEKLKSVEVKGEFVYRLVINVPSRRLVVANNRRLWIDRIDMELIPEGSSAAKTQTVRIGAWMEPGSNKTIDFDAVGRQATARIYARGDRKMGYGNLTLTLLQAKVFDNVDSPYADAVSSGRAILRALDHEDISSIRAMAARMLNDLRPTAPPAQPVARTIEVVAPSAAEGSPEFLSELQAIEDLLTGTDAERRQGLDRLHQLIRRLRPR